MHMKVPLPVIFVLLVFHVNTQISLTILSLVRSVRFRKLGNPSVRVVPEDTSATIQNLIFVQFALMEVFLTLTRALVIHVLQDISVKCGSYHFHVRVDTFRILDLLLFQIVNLVLLVI